MPEIERFGAHAFHMRTALGGTFIHDKKEEEKEKQKGRKKEKSGDSDR